MIGEQQVVLVAGATGLVGRALVAQLCASARVRRVVAVARRPLGLRDEKIEERVLDLARLDEEPAVAATAACCALGTTIAAAGSPEAFRRVDHGMTLAFARYAKRCGARQFVVVSSVGADRASRAFYLRVKGETEEALRAVGFESLVVMRPGLLLGHREESRPAETAGRALAPLFNLLLPGPLARYRAVPAAQVAAAMVASLDEAPPGTSVMEYREIERSAARVSRAV